MNRLILLSVWFICALKGIQSQNVTELPDNLSFAVNQTVSQIRVNIRHLETQVELLRLHFQNLVTAITYNSRLVDRRYQAFEAELYRSAIISLDYSTCVGRYQSSYVPIGTTFQSQLSSCVSVTNSRGSNLAAVATNNINYARTQIETNLRADINNCLRLHQNLQNLTSCVNSRIVERSRFADTYLVTAEREVYSAFCRAEQIAKEGQECVFQVVINVGNIIGNVTASVDNCINWQDRNSIGCSIEVNNPGVLPNN